MKDEMRKGVACDSVGKPESILGRAVCLSVHPGKMILFPFMRWFDTRYKGRYKFARLLFSFDLLLIGVILGLATAAIFFSFSKPTAFEDKIHFEAIVAPLEIKTGSPSTLVIRYTNDTDEELREARLELTYPDHFLLQDLSVGDVPVEDTVIELGSIPVGGTGTVRVRGVMFGDVGGEQTFTSELTFIHGTKKERVGRKTSAYTFSPSSSTLTIDLMLPERLVAYQEVEGTLAYHNTGEIDFPMISIEPEWPTNFVFQSSPVALIQGVFTLPAIIAGESGEMTFRGFLGDAEEEVTFVFHPSFTFGTSLYKQQTLTHTAPVVPPQIRVGQSVEKSSVLPGGEARFTIQYANTGEYAVTDLVLAIESDNPFLSQNTYEAPSIDTVASGESGQVEIRVPLRESISQSETDVYENIDLITQAIATYTLEEDGQRVISKSSPLTSAITTPVILESFGRYTAASGDQLGRGPLPPRVGSETKYWVFWHVSGTINEIQNIKIEGTLGENVVFTGRQSTSQDTGVEYDQETGTISWEAVALPPTLSPSSKIVGVAFELAITPDESMVGEIPVLISNINLRGVDARTGAFISGAGASVTTELPDDLMAAGKAMVER